MAGLADLQTQITTLQGTTATLLNDFAAIQTANQTDQATIAQLQSKIAALPPSDDGTLEALAQSLQGTNATVAAALASFTPLASASTVPAAPAPLDAATNAPAAT